MISIVWPALIALIGFILLILYVPPPVRMQIVGGCLLLAGLIAVCLMLGHTRFGLPG